MRASFSGYSPGMRLLALALLAASLPGFASAQSGSSSMTPIQRCEQNNQMCIRDCTGANAQACMQNCAAARAQCIQNPSTATQPRR